MTHQEKQTTVIPKEKAVFRMDGQGVWHNEHGPFEHPKIIQYFNRSIQKDEDGYFLSQEMEHAFEKVYFPYEETAVFVSDLGGKDPMVLLLNTGKKIPLTPDLLFTRNDSLFMTTPDHLVKFSSKALVKLSRHLEERDGELVLVLPSGESSIPAG